MCDSFATEVPPAFCEGVFGIVQDVYGEDVFRERVLCRLRQLRIRDDENAFAVDCPDLLDIPDTATRAERERARTELGAVCALHPKACDVEGRCSAGFLGGNPGDADELRCVATAEGCRATKQCEVAGRCTPGKAASCVVASDADCVKSRVCTEWGHCTRAESGQAPPFGEVNARCVSKEEARELGDGRPWVHIVVSVEGEPKAPDAISLQAYAQLGAVRGCAQTTMEREPEADAREVRVTLDLREGKPQSVKASDPVAHRKPLEKCMRAAVGSMRFGKEEEPGVALKFTFDTRNHRDPALPPAWLSEMKAVDPSRL